jgi:hypothetical protein
MPENWTVAAHLEAEWRVARTWKHNSLRELARHLTVTGPAITQMRADPRYLPMVARIVWALRQPRISTTNFRASLEKAYDRVTEED